MAGRPAVGLWRGVHGRDGAPRLGPSCAFQAAHAELPLSASSPSSPSTPPWLATLCLQVETRSTGVECETGQREEEHMGATDQVGLGHAGREGSMQWCLATGLCWEALETTRSLRICPTQLAWREYKSAAGGLCLKSLQVVEVTPPSVEQPTAEYFTKV